MRWYGYALRINKDRIPKKVLNMKIKGKHPRGRLKSRWKQQGRAFMLAVVAQLTLSKIQNKVLLLWFSGTSYTGTQKTNQIKCIFSSSSWQFTVSHLVLG
jgi:hypothetical protein